MRAVGLRPTDPRPEDPCPADGGGPPQPDLRTAGRRVAPVASDAAQGGRSARKGRSEVRE